MAAARYDHTATLLPGGQVLVAGGLDAANLPLATSLRFNPTSNGWSAADTMVAVRYGHTATLLADGRVLVTGGVYVDTAELYDPSTSTWSPAASMATKRAFHTATLLPGGKVLVAGGQTGEGLTASAEVYDPGSDAWAPAASMSTPRNFHTATLLADGKVLATGGVSGSVSVTASADLYDAVGDTWSPAPDMTASRYDHAATLLASGNVLVSGGSGPGLTYTASAEVYDPLTAIGGTWAATGSMSDRRVAHTATLLTDGRVLAAGGNDSSVPTLASADLYDPGAGTWSPAASLATARYSTRRPCSRTGASSWSAARTDRRRSRARSCTRRTRSPTTIATNASPDIVLGAGTLTDTAVVSGRTHPQPGAFISWKLYGPDNPTCSGTPVYSHAHTPYPVAGGSVRRRRSRRPRPAHIAGSPPTAATSTTRRAMAPALTRAKPRP